MDTRTLTEQQQADAALVARCLAGDGEAFQELTVRYYRPVGAFILKRVQRSDLVEDLAQETFLEAYRSLKMGRRPERFSSWLFGIAHNCCGKWLRRRRPLQFGAAVQAEEIAAPPVESIQEEVEEQRKLLTTLETSLAGLPEETRLLLDLKHRQGRTCEQIASQLGRPVGTVKSLLSRTYKTLRVRLAPCGEE
jgi:RNA polymerase sigma-70 factor (ECF subfamily)